MVIVMIDKNNTRIMSNIEKTWEDLNIQVDNISEDRKALLIETDHLQLKCFKISWFRSSSLVNAKTRTNIKKNWIPIKRLHGLFLDDTALLVRKRIKRILAMIVSHSTLANTAKWKRFNYQEMKKIRFGFFIEPLELRRGDLYIG